MVSTVPLTFGSHEVTAYGAVSLKLNALFLVNVWVEVPFDPLILVNVPTAYIFPPQSTSWRICSVVPVSTSVGVPLTGVGDTRPACASAGVPVTADRERQQAAAATPAVSARRTLTLADGGTRLC